MDIVIPVLFYILAFIFIFCALLEERTVKESDDEQEAADHLVILLLVFSCACFWIAGPTMMFVTETYYSPITDTIIETSINTDYRPIGWLGIGFGVFTAYLALSKGIELLFGDFPKSGESVEP